MLITVCKSKIHRATVTGCETHYEGSITIDPVLVKKADMVVYEKVAVANVTNGNRFETYIIEGEPGKGEIILNGAAAHKGKPGDIIIILAYGHVEKEKAIGFKPVFVKVNSKNQPVD